MEPRNQALPIGYKLNEYEIRKVLSMGGFSYVYLAHDENKNIVAIKEYLPVSLALRTSDSYAIEPTSYESTADFRFGLKCFFEEGRALANITHKNIVRVTNFFRANDTVYMVMEYERGKSLQDSILEYNGSIPESYIRRIFSELLNGLREVHARKMLHLDIKPGNIYIRLDGSPVLLDFGSARQTFGSNKSKLPPSFTPGFASPEQHNDRELLGPWSDVYSVGATMYACISRNTPLSADKRRDKDILVPAKTLGHGRYGEIFLDLIDTCMSLNHLERPQSILTLQKLLLNETSSQDKKADLIYQLKNNLLL